MSASDLSLEALEANLNDFDPAVRARSLAELLDRSASGQLRLAPEIPAVNMHCHTFNSFNAYGYSPTGLAWLAKRKRLPGAGDRRFRCPGWGG